MWVSDGCARQNGVQLSRALLLQTHKVELWRQNPTAGWGSGHMKSKVSKRGSLSNTENALLLLDCHAVSLCSPGSPPPPQHPSCLKAPQRHRIQVWINTQLKRVYALVNVEAAQACNSQLSALSQRSQAGVTSCISFLHAPSAVELWTVSSLLFYCCGEMPWLRQLTEKSLK